MMGGALSTWWTAMPYLLSAIGGTEKHVGLALALHMSGYAACLVFANRNHQLNCRKATRTAATIILSACLVSMLGMLYAMVGQNHRLGLVWLLLAMGCLSGMAMAFYWPFLMSWASADLEGGALSRRLGAFNRGWSGAVLFGPLIGAGLVDIGVPLPLVAAAAFLVLCWLLLTRAHASQAPPPLADTPVCPPLPISLSMLWMARLALVCAWGGLAITRSQFALRFTDLGYRPSLFGVLMTLCALVIYLVLAGMGRWHAWHGNKMWLWLVPVLEGAALLLFAHSSSFIVFGVAMSMQGAAVAISYSAHQYYGAARSVTRSASMTIHELMIAIATILGSTPAGYLAYYCGPLSPYLFGLTLCGVAHLSQTVLIARGRHHYRPLT
jgi:MFS family permease